MIDHVQETARGVVGCGTTLGAAFVAWLTANGESALHVVSVLVTILAGAGTALYYWGEWRARRMEREQTNRRQTNRRRTALRKKTR